jgi:hypothetical protein
MDREWDWRGVWALAGAAAAALDWHPVGDNLMLPIYTPEPNDACNAQTPNRPLRVQGTGCVDIQDQLPSCQQPLYAASQKMWCAQAAYFSHAPRSLHPGGVVTAALDGHAGFLGDTIDSITFAYLVATTDRQPADVAEYMK